MKHTAIFELELEVESLTSESHEERIDKLEAALLDSQSYLASILEARGYELLSLYVDCLDHEP